MKKLAVSKKIIKGIILFALFYYIADFIYRIVYNISYLTREKCILYRMLPKLGFLFFEYFIELFVSVIVGIFLAAAIESYFSKYKRFYPKSMITAFFYASALPVCACTTIPLIGALRDKLKFRTIITFVVAAPLLSPYIIMLSFSVLGIKYGLFRIISSFILAVLSGLVVEFFYSGKQTTGMIVFNVYNSMDCNGKHSDIYLQTYEIFKRLFPFLMIASIVGIVIETIAPANFLTANTLFKNLNNPIGVFATILIAIPIYLCNGVEILLLRPLIHQSGLSLGTSIAFSLASTSICITSFVMLIKFIGKKLAFALLGNLIIVILLLGLIINTIFPEISFPFK